MSYVPADDTHENGRLSAFCSALSGEVGLHRGEDFPIFQHKNNSTWGQQWQERLDATLGAVTFLIPIITPRFAGNSTAKCGATVEEALQLLDQVPLNAIKLLPEVRDPATHQRLLEKADQSGAMLLGHQAGSQRRAA
jgi:hypothetical protein